MLQVETKTKFKETEIGLMPEEWEIKCLSDFANFSYGTMPKKEKISQGDYPVFSGYKYQFNYPESNCKCGDVIVVARGVGGTGDVKLVEKDCFLTNLSILVKLNLNHAIPKFIYYYYGKSNLRYLDSGSAQSQITINDLSKVVLALPPLPEQKAIVEILSSLDEKIELNRRMNKTLEEMGKALFKRWFVDFEFPNEDGKPYKSSGGKMIDSELGEIPEGWQIKNLSELCSYINRGIPPSYTEEEMVCVINQRCIRDGYVSLFDSRYTDPNKRKILGEKLLQDFDILINSTGTGTLGRVAQLWRVVSKLTLDSHVTVVRPDKLKIDPLYLGICLKKMQNLLEDLAEGSTGQTELPREKLKQVSIVAPTHNVMNKFSSTISSLLEIIYENFKEVNCLETIREDLLPKLISGKIRTI